MKSLPFERYWEVWGGGGGRDKVGATHPSMHSAL